MLSIILLTKPVIVLIMLCSLMVSWLPNKNVVWISVALCCSLMVTKQECGVDFSCQVILSGPPQSNQLPTTHSVAGTGGHMKLDTR